MHQMTSRVLRERPRNRPQLSEDCEAGPHKSRDMRRHCQVPVEYKTEITNLVLRLNSIRTNDKRVAVLVTVLVSYAVIPLNDWLIE